MTKENIYNIEGISGEEASVFIDSIKEKSSLLKGCRLKKMNGSIEKIPSSGIGQDIFHPDTSDEYESEPILLIGQPIKLEFRLSDAEIESPAREELIFHNIATELEVIALNKYAKIIKDSGQYIDITTQEDRGISKEKLLKIYKSIGTKYRSGLNRFYMPTGILLDYESLCETSINDISKKGAFGIAFERVYSETSNIILTENTNLIIGIQKDIIIKTEKNKENWTKYTVEIKCDFTIENTKAVAMLTGVETK